MAMEELRQRPQIRKKCKKELGAVANSSRSAPLLSKAQIRDYSFLLSDAELPPSNSQPNVFPPKSEAAWTAKLPEKCKGVTLASKTSRGTVDKKVGITAAVAARPTPESAVANSSRSASLLSKVQMRDYSFLLSDAELPPPNFQPRNVFPSKSEATRTAKLPEKCKGVTLASKTSRGTVDKKIGIPAAVAAKPPPKSAMQRPLVPSRKNLSVPKHSLPRKREILPKQQVPRPSSKPLAKGSLPRPSSKPSFSTKQQVPRPSSKPMAKRSFRTMEVDNHGPKKRSKSRDDYSDEKGDLDHAISEIRKMFGYNPRKYVDDDDDMNMVANFQDIEREEKRSARIAKKEDREELLKIQEEERRERLLNGAKKRKI